MLLLPAPRALRLRRQRGRGAFALKAHLISAAAAAARAVLTPRLAVESTVGRAAVERAGFHATGSYRRKQEQMRFGRSHFRGWGPPDKAALNLTKHIQWKPFTRDAKKNRQYKALAVATGWSFCNACSENVSALVCASFQAGSIPPVRPGPSPFYLATMRTLAYAAAAYVACAGGAAAFAPMPASVPRARAPAVTQLRMAEDASAVLARMNAMMNGEPVSPIAAASSLESSYNAPAAAPVYQEDAASILARMGPSGAPTPTPTWRWSGADVGGYNPRSRRAGASAAPAYSAPAAPAMAAEDPAAVMARVMAMMK